MKETISIVIPAYNEANRLADCLDSIKKQTVAPLQIILVDNNSSDDTVAIAKLYKDITILHEPRQGQRFAQITGFKAAKGSIVVRLDADTIISENYIEKLLSLAHDNPHVGAFTGYGISRYEALPKTSLLWSWCYFTYTHAYFGVPMLWGANMAFRKPVLRKVQPLLIEDAYIHEDQDIALAVHSLGVTTIVSSELLVSVEMEGVQHFNKFHSYVKMMHNTKQLDSEHPRYALPTRRRNTSLFVRSGLWIVSAWSVYAFYAITIFYSAYYLLKKELTARLFLADRPQDS
jgi:cellulose synthase/poly-beta-1,6-N-acetylglucosamine synthase-like glycosyltransferase